MATIDDALYELSKADSGLAALISDRVYPDLLPEGVTFPAMTFQEISLTPIYSQDGDSHLDTSRYQFDCYAVTRSGSRAVADALRSLLSGKRTSQSGFAIHSAFLANALSGYETGLNAWRYTVDYMISYSW